MRRAQINVIVDILALISFSLSILSELVLFLVLPSGGEGFRGGTDLIADQIFLNLSRADWRFFHNAASLIFAGLVVLHLLLHWRYFRNIRKVVQSRAERRDVE
jgi:hypothetical protein